VNDYKVNFKQLKSRVGIDDVAYALGYRLDRKAGVGRYIELVLGDGTDRRDTLIISHPNDKARQTFFRRDGSKGDVVTLIRENIGSFFATGTDEWQRVAQVMARFANKPEPEYNDGRQRDKEYVKSVHAEQSRLGFDSSRYEVRAIDCDHIPALFTHRGISAETVQTFSPFLSLIRDTKNGKFDGYNVGFPYVGGESDDIKGYEIRGYGGYKSKAAGTDSSTSAWMASLSKYGSESVESAFFFESALDAMSFYQMNRMQLRDNPVALVSLGGTFSDGQIKSAVQRFPNARAFDCFDNDIAGRIYGLRMMALLENIPLKIDKTVDGLAVEAKGRRIEIDTSRPILAQVSKELYIRYRMGQWLPPKAFKDWNDCQINKPMQPLLSPHKEEREQNLAERRSGGMKM